MKPTFNVFREQNNELYCKNHINPQTPYHFHSAIELLLIHSGAVEVWINDSREILKGGEISVAMSYDAHSYRTMKEAAFTSLIIPMEYCEEFLRTVRNKRLKAPIIRDKETYKELDFCCRGIMSGCNKIKTTGYVYQILGTLLEQMKVEQRTQPADPALATRLLFYINEHYKEPLTLNSIAVDLGYNPSYLSRYFKENFHIGLNKYITIFRLRKAIMLMREKEKNISVCAYESGFNSTRTFYRAFSEEFQCAPREYMEKQ